MATICSNLFSIVLLKMTALRTHGFYELCAIGFTKQVQFKTPQEYLCDYAGDVPITVQFSIDQNYHEWCNFQICLIVKFHSVQIISIGCYNKNNSKLVIKRHHSLRCGIVCTQFICSLSISFRKKHCLFFATIVFYIYTFHWFETNTPRMAAYSGIDIGIPYFHWRIIDTSEVLLWFYHCALRANFDLAFEEIWAG